MDAKVKVPLVPFMVFGILIAVCVIAVYLTHLAGIGSLHAWLGIPSGVLAVLGILLTVISLPVFVAGVRTLGGRTIAGFGDHVVSYGIYRYTRNPMYYGLHVAVVGLGLLLNSTGIFLAGILAVIVGLVHATRERQTLLNHYGDAYRDYMQHTPFYVPAYGRMMRDFLNRSSTRPQVQ